VSAARLTEGGVLIGWAGGQSALPSPSGEGVTAGDGWGVSPNGGQPPNGGRGDLLTKIIRIKPSPSRGRGTACGEWG